MNHNIINYIISSFVLVVLIIVVKKIKLWKNMKNEYNNRNKERDIQLQKIQDLYYAHKRKIQNTEKSIMEIKEKIHQLEIEFKKDKQLLMKKSDKLKQEKYKIMYNEARKELIKTYIRNKLILACKDHNLQNQMVEYMESTQ